MSECKVIALTNQKGGCAKTTTTANLGVGLAKLGYKVLLIDLDPQASLTLSLGFKKPDELETTVSDVMIDAIKNGEITMEHDVLQTEEGVSLMPSNIGLCSLEVGLVNEMSRESILKTYVDTQRSNYDYILIDCMPSLGMLTMNALVAADKVIIPTQTEFLSVKGLEQLSDTIRRISKRMNPNLKVDGILMTMTDYRTKFSKEVALAIKNTYGDTIRIYQTSIPRSIRVAEASSEGKSIFAKDPYGKAAQAYHNLAMEVENFEPDRFKIRTMEQVR